MRLLVGLGNPGPAHAGNRHNIGFMAVDRIAAGHGLGPWRARFQGLAAEGRLGDGRVVLLKPQTFMNLSGQSVGQAMRFYKLAPADVTVFHDEIDLAPGRLRLKAGGGHAGHNGLRSIHAHIGEGYGRVRLGVGHPGHKDRVAGHVLDDFARADGDWLEPLLEAIAAAAPALAAGDGARFQAEVARRLAPAPPARDRGAGPGRAAAPRPAPPGVPAPAPPTEPEAPAAPGPGTAAPAAQGEGPEGPAPGGEPGGVAGRLRRLAARFR